MLLAQDLLAHEETETKRNSRHGCIEDPFCLQAVGVCLQDHLLNRGWQRLDQLGGSGRIAVGQHLSRLGRQHRPELAVMRSHAVLEDDASNDDRNGRGYAPRKGAKRSRTRDVGRLGHAEDRDDRSLEQRPDADRCDDLVEYDPWPGRVRLEVDVQPVSEEHERRAEVERRTVSAGLFDVAAG